MPKPTEICLEELVDAPDPDGEQERFIRCVALSGGEPGLSLDRRGQVQWMPQGEGAYGLWVSADDRLVLYRSAGTAPIAVERGTRRLEAPVARPVILLDQDELVLVGLRLRVHVHGETEAVYAPERLSRSSLARLARAAAVAAGLALGGAAAAAAGSPSAAAGAGRADPAAASPATGQEPIEVRLRPPKVSPRKPLDCTITRQAAASKGPLVLHATCPTTVGLAMGHYGSILDPQSGGSLKNGTVTITSIKGKAIVLEAKSLTRAVQAKTIRFWVER